MIDFSLYLITDRYQTGGRPLTDVVQQALEAGVRAVQLREKDLSSVELYRLAGQLRRLTADFGARLIINERLDIAQAVGADGAHLGISSLPVTVARSVLGRDKIIGYSAHSRDEAVQAAADGADFVTCGPVYYTASKAAYGAPCGVEKLAAMVAAVNVPVFGLGGITPATLPEVLSAGCTGIALISAILSAVDPGAATSSLLKKIEEHATLS